MPDDKTIDFVVAFVSIGMLVLGLGSVALGWIVRQYDRVMLRWGATVPNQFDTDDRAVSRHETNTETAEIPQRVGETQAETFTLGETTALARLVASGKLGLTDAVKIGADAKSGEKYQKRSREIRAMVNALHDKYPNRTPEQQRARDALGLSKP